MLLSLHEQHKEEAKGVFLALFVASCQGRKDYKSSLSLRSYWPPWHMLSQAFDLAHLYHLTRIMHI